jgi:hypothetical protein
MTVNQEASEAAPPGPDQWQAPVTAKPEDQVTDPSDASQIGAYSQREYVFHEREDKRELSFEYIVNDGLPNHLIWCDRPSP